MRIKHIGLVGVLGACVAPSSAGTVTVQWNSVYTGPDTVLVWADVYIQGDAPLGFGSTIFDVIGDDDAYPQGIDHDEADGHGRYLNEIPFRPGVMSGDDILGIDAVQLPQAFNSNFNTDSTILEFFGFEYTITDHTPRCVTYTSEHLNFDVYLEEWGTSIPYEVVVVPTQFCIGELDTPPVAVAGDDEAVHAGSRVNLDGSGSFDDNTPSEELLYEWSIAETPPDSTTVIADPTAAQTSFIADLPGTYVVELVVWDVRGQASEPDQILFSSENLAPTAVAGDDIVSVRGWEVALSGADSTDPEEDPLTYSWTMVSWPQSSTPLLADETAVDCLLLTDIPGDYVIGLVVSDLFGPSEPDYITVTAITGEEFVENAVDATIDVVVSLPSEDVSTPGNQTALTNFLNEVIRFVQSDDPEQARHKLEQCIERTDGCVLRGGPDGNGPGRDWIIDCDVQWQIYSELTAALDALDQ